MLPLTMGKLISFLLLVKVTLATTNQFDDSICNSTTKDEVASKSAVVNRIIDAVVRQEFRGTTYNELAKFVDTFGSRMSGTKSLEDAINYMVEASEKHGLNVTTEEVKVFNWKRGEERLCLVSPVERELIVLGMGGTVGTPRNGIKATGVVIQSIDECSKMKEVLKNKIVILKSSEIDGDTISLDALNNVSKCAAKAVLVVSQPPLSIDTPHTRFVRYEPNVIRIPVVSISLEDGEMLQRMQARGEKIALHLWLNDVLKDTPKISRNTIVELQGSSRPNEVVIVSGHIDSWDVGDGAMDDGGGAFISWMTLVVLKQLGIRPKRTIRCALWTGDELGLYGVKAYAQKHKSEFRKISVVMESDTGTFEPRGLIFSGKSSKSQCIVYESLQLLQAINSTELILDPAQIFTGLDVFRRENVPTIQLQTQNEEYFDFHHSIGDRMTRETPRNLDLCTAVWASTAFVFADVNDSLE